MPLLVVLLLPDTLPEELVDDDTLADADRLPDELAESDTDIL